MKTRIILIICLITGIAAHLSANKKIYINREVTTHIVMPEYIKMVDISTTRIIGMYRQYRPYQALYGE